ncbi:MAG: metal ABC transporter substrate-binding protein [Magnetococcales bacterium]|nr:metal ABC transporter substrate-binding protein [Magnetococcales bacterium]
MCKAAGDCIGRKRWGALLLLWLLWVGVGTAAAQEVPIRVVASFSILADLVAQVGGEAVTVKSLVGADGDAHVYEPLPADVVAVQSAQMFVVNGLGFEGWMQRLIKASDFRGLLVTASTGIQPLSLSRGPGVEPAEVADPHAWHDLRHVQVYVRNMAEGLARLAPERSALFRANADRYQQELVALDRWVREVLATIPPERRTVISSHDAFGYFTQAYGVTFLAPVGVSSDAEPSAAQVAKLIGQIKKRKIKAIFLENRSNPRMVKQLIKESGAVLGGTLYTDALSTAEGPAPSFLAMVRHNVTALSRAMGD